MKKHIFRIMIVMLFACLGLTAFVACAPEENKETFTVTYAAGEGTGTGPASEKHAEGETFTVAENTFTYEGYTFKTWNDGTKDVAVGATYTMPAKDVTFTAQWTKNATPVEKVTVTFSLGDYTTGTAPAAQEVEKGAQVTLPEAPIWADHTFKGWKVGTDATLKQAGDKITVSENVTVTAQWEASIEGYWTVTGVNIEVLGVTSAFDVEIALREDGSDHLYVVWNLTSGQTSYIDAFYIEMIDSAWQLEDAATITLQNGKLHVKIMNVEFDLATHTAFTDEFTPTGTYSATVSGSEHYMDFDQWGYDGGNGYMDDVDFVTVGKYVAVFESTQDDELGSLAVLIEGKSGAIEGYDDEGIFATFTACDAREKTVSYNVFELEQEDDRAYVIIEGTYAGFTPSGLRDLQEDQVIEEYNISLFLKNPPWSIYPNVNTGEGSFVNRELTIAAGVITAKFDVTDLPITDVGYGAAAMNNGSGDLSYGSTPSDYTFRIGDTVYTLKGGSGSVVVLKVEAYNHATDWTGVTTTPTAITLTLNDAKDKALLTISGTYTGTTKEHMQELLSQKYNNYNIIFFWGATAGTETPDLVVTADETTWKIVVDVTALKDDVAHAICTQKEGFNPRKSGSGTEFQFAGIEDTTVRVGDKCYTLMEAGGSFGHNTLSTGTPVTVTYGLNGWTDGTAPAPATVAKGANVVLPELEEREGYIFKGWKVGTDDKGGDVIQQPGSRLSVSADITVTAIWTEAGTVSGIWTFTQEGETTKLYIADSIDGLIVVLETNSGKEAMSFTQTDSGWSCGSKTLTVSGSSLVFKADQTITFTVRAAFAESDTAEVPEEGVYSFKAADKDALYVDFSYKAIDLGEGYLDDAEFATVGKFVVALVEKDGAKQGPVFEVAESGSITAYNATASMALTACEARAKVFGADDGRPCAMTYSVALENGKVYLYVSGTYQGYKPSEFLQLCEDVNVYTANISVYPNIDPWKPIYPDPREDSYNYIERTHVVGEGKVTAKLDITGIPIGTYGIASQNNGYGDLGWGSNEAQSVSLGGLSYALGSNGGNVQLAIAPDWTGVTAAVTSISLALDNEDAAKATKVLLTYEGTYSGCTKEAMKGLLEAKYGGNTFFYFWGATSHADPVKDFTVTVGDGTWKIVIDATDLPVETCRNLCGFSGVNGSSITTADLKYNASIVKENSITFNGKTYSLVLSNGWGNNGLNVEAVAE